MTFKQILEAAQKNLATDIYLTINKPVYIRTRQALKPITKKAAPLNQTQIEQLIKKLIEKTENIINTSEDSTSCYYRAGDINYFKVNISNQQQAAKIHLQVIHKSVPNSNYTTTEFLDGYSSLRNGLVLLTGKHQCGLTHTLNSLIYMSNLKNEKLIGHICQSNPWEHKNLNSLVYQFNFKEDITKATEQALKHNCDMLFFDDLSLKDIEKIYPLYTFDRPTFMTLNYESLLQAVKAIKKSPIYHVLKNQIKIITHQQLFFSHLASRNIPLFEYLTPSTRLFSSIENDSLLNSLLSFNDLEKKDRDENLISTDQYLARLVRGKYISSQQATQMSHRPNELMKLISTMDEQDKTEVTDKQTLASSPALQFDKEWTSIENIPIDNED